LEKLDREKYKVGEEAR